MLHPPLPLAEMLRERPQDGSLADGSYLRRAATRSALLIARHCTSPSRSLAAATLSRARALMKHNPR